VVMGQPEGQGCYCAANTLLTGFLERLTGNYPYIVMDNEAGMEHISRLTTRDVDILLIVADTSRRSLQAAFRINKLAEDLNIGMKKSCLVINQARGKLSEAVLDMIRKEDLKLAGTIPADDQVYEFDLNGRASIQLPEDCAAVANANRIFDTIMNQ